MKNIKRLIVAGAVMMWLVLIAPLIYHIVSSRPAPPSYYKIVHRGHKATMEIPGYDPRFLSVLLATGISIQCGGGIWVLLTDKKGLTNPNLT